MRTATNDFRRFVSSVALRPGLLCAVMLAAAAVARAETAAGAKPNDSAITAAVENDLLIDASVPFDDIDVAVTHGVVMLSGAVPNIMAKERAAIIAGSIRGVRSVVNNLMVKAGTRSDEDVRQEVEAALKSDPATDSYEVTPSVEDGTVTLTGSVDSWQERQLAAWVAKGVRGVVNVDNEIEVVHRSDRRDEEIAAEIQRILARDIWVDHAAIEVDVKNGKVTLRGPVRSVAEKIRVESRAWTAGVKSVDHSGVVVDPDAKSASRRRDQQTVVKTDEEIGEAVRDAFLHDPRVISFNPEVVVNNGVVTLSGTVDNLKAKQAAELDAKNTVGVRRVENHLKVRTKQKPTGAELARAVRQALVRDPYLERYEVVVSAIDGTIHLNGTVDSQFEKTQAGDVASRVNGVRAVKNNLAVDYPGYSHHSWPYSSYYSIPYYPYGEPLWLDSSNRTDAEIKEDIESEFFWSVFVDGGDIEVSVDDGTATLTGKVDRINELSSATENAYEGGARRVINKLVIDSRP